MDGALRARLRGAFVLLWIAAGVAVCAGHRAAPESMVALSRVAPWARYPAVMFHRMPPAVPALTWVDPSGKPRPVSALEPAQALGYAEARVQLDALMSPAYLQALCARAEGGQLRRVLVRPATGQVQPMGDACGPAPTGGGPAGAARAPHRVAPVGGAPVGGAPVGGAPAP